MTTVRRSLLLSLAERYFGILIQLVSFFVLARLLTPAQIGLYSVAAATIGLAQVVRDFGIGSYLIQESDITPERVRTAFTLTGLISLASFLILVGSAPWLAGFYDHPELGLILQVLAINFLLIPFSSTALALLRRSMNFKALFWIATAANLISTLGAIGCAAAGLGAWSLVASSIANTLVTALMAAWFADGGFLHRPCLLEWRRILHFGGQSTLARTISEIALSFNDLVVGRVLGFAEVGLLSRAQGVMSLFHRDVMAAIRNVAYPAFANSHRNNQGLDEIHTRSVSMVAAFAWPFYGLFALFPTEALRLMFGPQWDAAAALVPIFCAAGAVAVVWSLVSTALTASGHVNLTVRIELVIQPVRIALLIACAWIFRTLESFAYVLLLTYVIQIAVTYTAKQTVMQTDFGALRRELAQSFRLSLVALAPACALRAGLMLLDFRLPDLVVFPLAGLLTLAGWLTGLWVVKHRLLSDPMLERPRAWLEKHFFARP